MVYICILRSEYNEIIVCRKINATWYQYVFYKIIIYTLFSFYEKIFVKMIIYYDVVVFGYDYREYTI